MPPTRTFALVLVCAATVLASTHASTSTDAVRECQTEYRIVMESAGTHRAHRCEAVSDYHRCLGLAVLDDLGDVDLESLVSTLVEDSYYENPWCRPDYGTEEQTYETASHERQRRDASSVNIYSIADSVTTLEAQYAGFDLDGTASDVAAALDSFDTSAIGAVAGNAGASFSSSYSRLAELELLVSDMQRASSSDLPAAVVAFNAEVSQRIVNQAGLRSTVRASLSSSVADVTSSLDSGLATATASRSTVRANIVAARSTLLASGSAALSTAVVAEGARVTPELSTQNAQTSSATVSYKATLTSSLSNRVAQSDAACLSRAALITPSVGTQSGSNDYGSCTTEGNIYYSTGSSRIYVCSEGAWATFPFSSYLMGGLLSSTTLSRAQAYNLWSAIPFVGSWALCFRASSHGFNSYTMHGYCDNRGMTLSVFRTGSGRIFGGFMDRGWYSQGSYMWSSNAFLWRVNPNDNTAINIAPVTNGNFGNAGYDQGSYGPTYGGHELYTTNGLGPGYSAANGYYGISGNTPGPYDNNWLAGCYSCWGTSELEVYTYVS